MGGMLKQMMDAFRKADPAAAAAFKKKNRGFGKRAAWNTNAAAKATAVQASQNADEWKPETLKNISERAKRRLDPPVLLLETEMCWWMAVGPIQ